MRFSQSSVKEIGAADKAAPATPGVVLIKSLQLSPVGPSGNWNVSALTVDVPEANFKQFRQFLFRFSAIGLINATATDILLSFRKNGGGAPINANNQVVTQNAASGSIYVNGNMTPSPAITAGAPFLQAKPIRTVEVWMDQYGYDAYVAGTALNTTNLAGAMHNATGSFPVVPGQGPSFAFGDTPGISLSLSAVNTFTPPGPGAGGVQEAAIFCDVYGWACK